jgi:anti-sigma factor RsiW
MSCQDLVELVTEYLEDALAPEDRVAVEAHLADCDGCTAYLEQMRTTIRLTGALTEEHVPREAREPLLRVFREWRSST